MNKQLTIFVGVLIHNGKILLVKRDEPECPEAHLKWEFAGGKVDFGETPEEAIVREYKEETGRIVKVNKLVPYVGVTYWEYAWGKQQTFVFVYLLDLIDDREPEKKDHHVAELAWVDIDKVDYANSLPLVEQIVKEARKVS
jgi:mutator protein MutT